MATMGAKHLSNQECWVCTEQYDNDPAGKLGQKSLVEGCEIGLWYLWLSGKTKGTTPTRLEKRFMTCKTEN